MIRTFAAAAAAASAIAVAAFAGDKIVLDVADVDFTETAQVEAVYAEIVEASRTICSGIYLEASVREVGLASRRTLYAQCVAATVDETVAAAQLPALSEVHAASAAASFAVASK